MTSWHVLKKVNENYEADQMSREVDPGAQWIRRIQMANRRYSVERIPPPKLYACMALCTAGIFPIVFSQVKLQLQCHFVGLFSTVR